MTANASQPHSCGSPATNRGGVLLSIMLALACGPLGAFVIPIHGEITTAALARFQSSIPGWEHDKIIQGAKDADLDEGALPFFRGPYDPRFHFDNEFSYEAVLRNYATIARLVDHNLSKPTHDPWEFGKMLHAIEDFYSHSNYVVIYRDYLAQNGNDLVGSIPTFEEVLLAPRANKYFIAMLRKDLHTGRYPLPRGRLLAKDTDHGLLVGPGMNKDWPERELFVDARETATQAAAWYLRLYIRDKQAERQWAVLKAPFSSGTH